MSGAGRDPGEAVSCAGYTVDGPEVRVSPCADGPVLVRGAERVVDRAGTPHPVARPVVALCTCERSQRAPWCDGTHKAVHRAERRRATPAPTRR